MHLQFRTFLWKVERGGAKVWAKGFDPGVRGSAAGLRVAIPTGDRQRQAGNRGCWHRSPETRALGLRGCCPAWRKVRRDRRVCRHTDSRANLRTDSWFVTRVHSSALISTARKAREIFSEMLPTDTAFRAQRSPAPLSPSPTPNCSFSPCAGPRALYSRTGLVTFHPPGPLSSSESLLSVFGLRAVQTSRSLGTGSLPPAWRWLSRGAWSGVAPHHVAVRPGASQPEGGRRTVPGALPVQFACSLCRIIYKSHRFKETF